MNMIDAANHFFPRSNSFAREIRPYPSRLVLVDSFSQTAEYFPSEEGECPVDRGMYIQHGASI
jgi:hypothetical protein